MTDQQEFDLLRQTRSTRLEVFISAARETERGMQQFLLPVSLEAGRQFTSQSDAEVEALENYTLASMRLCHFLRLHMYTVN